MRALTTAKRSLGRISHVNLSKFTSSGRNDNFDDHYFDYARVRVSFESDSSSVADV